jgi:ribosome-associated protein
MALDDDRDLAISRALQIPRRELTFRASRSGGPGGQHVNTSSTRVELWWDVAGSPSLSDAQRQRLLDKLSTRLDGSGQLRLVSAGTRSQTQNKAEVTARFQRIIREALVVPRARRPTKPTKASKQRRLAAKRRRSEIKQRRGPLRPDD